MSSAVTIPQQVDGAIVFRAGLAVDADGAFRAYNLDGSGLDSIRNAKDANGNWLPDVVVLDASGKPVQQGPNDPAPGFLISQSALSDPSKAKTDPTKYVDAETTPYVSVPPELLKMGAHKGDLGFAVYRGAGSGAIIADVGPHRKYGEGSIALAFNLQIDDSPRDGGVDSGVTYIIFPNTRTSPPWPRDVEVFLGQARDLFTAWGGMIKLGSLDL